MNTVTSFNTIARQTTEMFQQKNDRIVSAQKKRSTPVGNTALGQRSNNAPSLATHGILAQIATHGILNGRSCPGWYFVTHPPISGAMSCII